MYCKNCGREIIGEARFCEGCGERLDVRENTSPSEHPTTMTTGSPEEQPPVKTAENTPSPPPLPRKQPKKKAGKAPVIIAIVIGVLIFLVVSGLGIGFVISRLNHQTPTATVEPTPLPTPKPTPTPAATATPEPTAVAGITPEGLTGSWISDPHPDGTYWLLEFQWPEYMAQEIVFFTGAGTPDFESIPALFNSGAWSDLDGSIYSSLWSLDGNVLTLGEFPLGSAFRIHVVDANTIVLDDGSGSSVFGTMRRFANAP